MIIYLQPKSSLPLLSSDTLYGAICSAICTLYENFDEMLEALKKSPPFLISSAFPFVGMKETAHFFPKPIERMQEIERQRESIEEKNRVKKLKKAGYIHESIFNKWINGEVNEAYLVENINDYSIKDGFVYNKELDLNFNIESRDVARNSINRQSQLSDIFYSFEDYYKNAGLFFLVKFPTKEYEKEYSVVIQSAIKFLRDRGFGGDVSSGKGHFEIVNLTNRDIIYPPEKGARFISLSRYHPTHEEIKAFKEQTNLWYDIYTKRGRDSEGSIRKQVRFFTEGSTFPELNKEIYGEAIMVGDKAIEFGYAYNVRMSG